MSLSALFSDRGITVDTKDLKKLRKASGANRSLVECGWMRPDCDHDGGAHVRIALLRES